MRFDASECVAVFPACCIKLDESSRPLRQELTGACVLQGWKQEGETLSLRRKERCGRFILIYR